MSFGAALEAVAAAEDEGEEEDKVADGDDDGPEETGGEEGIAAVLSDHEIIKTTTGPPLDKIHILDPNLVEQN